MKKLTIVGLFLLGVIIFYGCSLPSEDTGEPPTFSGIPLEEAKSDQPDSDQTNPEAHAWKTYIDEKAGYKITFPDSWKDFRVDQNVMSGQNGKSKLETGFGGWEPNFFYLFSLFEEPRSTYKNFLKAGAGSEFSSAYVGESINKDNVVLCFGACCNGGNGIDKYGSFERERCAEVPAILKTFESVN